MVACRGVVLYHPPTLWASITVTSLAPLPRKTRAFLHPFVPCSVGRCRSFARSFFRLFIRSFRFAHSLFCSIKISSFVCLLVCSFIIYCSSARPLSHYPFVRSFTIFLTFLRKLERWKIWRRRTTSYPKLLILWDLQWRATSGARQVPFWHRLWTGGWICDQENGPSH